jgi:hypothetical protein
MGEVENLVNQQSLVEVDAYNQWVVDFNARCASFRYDLATFDLVKRQVEQSQAALKAEAKRRLAELHTGNADGKPAPP